MKLFEHNNWANLQIIQACVNLSDEQLDAEPQTAVKGSIRQTLLHLVSAQQNYLRTLSLPLEERRERFDVAFSEIQEYARKSGEALLSLAKGERAPFRPQLQTRDGHLAKPWVIMVQAINRATEHREQIKSMLSAQGITPPSVDGWDYGEVTKALVPLST